MNSLLPAILPKPLTSTNEILYSHYEMELDGSIAFRSLDLSNDLDLLHDWTNQQYARRFWQMEGSKQLLRNTYVAILENPRAHSFMACFNDRPIGLIDLYGVVGDELAPHCSPTEIDCGLHLLMLPTKQLQKGWSVYTLKNFQRYYFSFATHTALFAEPDQENVLANKLAIDAGFRFLKTVELSNKTANLYSITRQQYK